MSDPISEAFKAVPRTSFVPDTIWVWRGDDLYPSALRRQDDPDGWLERVRSDDAVITQVDMADPAAPGFWPTSSCSAPGVVREMLELLELAPGMRVLEIGTGTGWNAALMAHIVGAANVTTVEIDQDVADQARVALDRASLRVRTIVADGEQGFAMAAPYDRVVATAAAAEVPHAWVRQTSQGGHLLVPWAPTIHPESPYALLTRSGEVAEGRFVSSSAFMPLRGQKVNQRERSVCRERWENLGRPGVERFRAVAGASGTRVWLDSPDGPVAL